MTIRRALISVSDKTGLLPFAQFLVSRGVEILSTGGTAELLRKHAIPVREVSEVTNFPEMMDGRLKTLHPAVHGGLLARRDDPAHMASASAHNIDMIDLLVVNLYPFETTLNSGADGETIIENIDIGGPAMIRAAAKNFASVTVIVDVTDYGWVQACMEEFGNDIPPSHKKRCAAKALARTAAYDTLIASWMSRDELAQQNWPAYFLDAKLGAELRYGENPHQKAALYQRLDAKGGIANAEQLQGKELSYNNLADAETAWQIASAFPCVASHGEPQSGRGQSQSDEGGVSPPSIITATLVKHANPCGVAIGATPADSFTRALACDPVSAFGGILAINAAVDAALVSAIDKLFLEVIVAPAFTDEARELLSAKKNLRLLIATPEHHASPLARWTINAISGGYLVQEADHHEVLPFYYLWKNITDKTATDAQKSDGALAWIVCQSVKSNAMVLVKNGTTIGIGAGQPNRVDALRIAIANARKHGHDPRGSVLASDAFLPFADNVEVAAEAGISFIVQPGGSVRDHEVIDAVLEHDIAMTFTGTRHFRH